MEATQGIPTFTHLERDLPPLPPPRAVASWYNAAETLDKLARTLSLCDESGQPVLLSALSALVNRKRLIFDASAVSGVFSEDLLEGTLLLLPAICREQVSVAAGALDERVCIHADLMVKTNGTPEGPLADDLIWAKRAGNQFFGALDNGALTSEYAGLLRPLLPRHKSLAILLQILDTLDSLSSTEYTSPWQALNNGWLTSRLIPALPHAEQRAEYWQAALKNLAPADWQAIIPTILDDTGLETAWASLQLLVERQPETYTPLIFQLWRNFSADYIHYVLTDELPANPGLAEHLLWNGLLSELGPNYQADLLTLCQKIIANRAEHAPSQAADLLDLALQSGRFDSPANQLVLKEACLPANPGQDDMLMFLNTQFAPAMGSLSPADLSRSQMWQELATQAPKVAQIFRILVEGDKNSAVDRFNQFKLNAALSETPEYAPALAHWLQLSGRGNWLSGRLLETLTRQWLDNPALIDATLLSDLLQPALTEKYTIADWLALAQLCWLPDYLSLWPLSGQPGLSRRQRVQTLNVARRCARRYTSPAQAQQLVIACQNWGLLPAELAELVSEFPAPACNFALIHPYLYLDDVVIAPTNRIAENLITLALQRLPVDPIEQAQLRLFFTRLLIRQLQSTGGVAPLVLWSQIVADTLLWQDAVRGAVTALAPDHFSLLVRRAQQLRAQGEQTLHHLIIAALDAYWDEVKTKS